MAEKRGEHNQDHGVGDPGQVLEGHVALKFPVDPLVGLKEVREKTENQFVSTRTESHTETWSLQRTADLRPPTSAD